jgi:hypothetical protein
MKKIILFLGLFFSASVFAHEYSNVNQLTDYAILRTKIKMDYDV